MDNKITKLVNSKAISAGVGLAEKAFLAVKWFANFLFKMNFRAEVKKYLVHL